MRGASSVRPVDGLLAVALMAVAAASVATVTEYDGGRPRLAVALLFQTLPLMWWRAAPLRAVLLSAFGVVIEVAGVPAYGDAAGLLGFLLLLYAVPRYAAPSQRPLGGAVLGAGFVAHLVAQPHEGPLGLLGPIVTTGAVSAAAWSLGSTVRRRADRVTELEAQREQEAARVAVEQAQLVEQERRRISRELHDIVGHALSAISLSAGAAEQQAGLSPQVQTALQQIRESSRGAATDLRRLVGLLRTAGDLEAAGPQPTLGAVLDLVDRCRAAGMTVQLSVEGDPSRVPPGVQLAAYRVVQEGLTNIAKHAGQAGASVRVQVTRAGVEVDVQDDGPLVAVPEQRGHGLTGLAERVQLYDGTLTTSVVPGGGLRLSAVLPVRP